MNKTNRENKNPEGLVGNLYEIKVLPNTAVQLVQAIYEQKDLSKEDALEMAAYLDERYGMSDYVPTQSKDSEEK